MSHDTSESSSDEEVAPTINETRQPKQSTRYQCPEDFTGVSYAPCRSARGQNAFDENKELWLIKAPANFNPRSLSGVKLPLAGLKTVKTKKDGASQQIFSVLGGRSTPTGLRLLTCDPKQPDAHLCAPAFSGVLNISESYGDCSSNQGPMAVPAPPPPRLPDGLRQRFLPFGSRRPVTAPVMAPAEEASVPLSSIKTEPDASQEPPRKRKKEKRIKVEVDATATVSPVAVVVKVEQATESIAERSMQVDGEMTEEHKKKKKKKKDKEREKVKTEEILDPYVQVKEEPMDTDQVDSEPLHKKKKKKKSKTYD